MEEKTMFIPFPFANAQTKLMPVQYGMPPKNRPLPSHFDSGRIDLVSARYISLIIGLLPAAGIIRILCGYVYSSHYTDACYDNGRQSQLEVQNRQQIYQAPYYKRGKG